SSTDAGAKVESGNFSLLASDRDSSTEPIRTCQNASFPDPNGSRVLHFTFNADCLRTSYGRVKPAGVFRIALVGDSTIEGNSVDDTDTVPFMLERLLNADPSVQRSLRVRFEVLNAGFGGATSRDLNRVVDKVFLY